MISIIVPVYNVESYLPRCMDSLFEQTYPAFEVILVDDGSTDMSGALCDRYAVQDPRIKVIHKKNGGLSSARNAGLDAAHGRYIMFLDGDDYLAPCALRLLSGVAAEVGEFDFIQFHYVETDGNWQAPPTQAANIRICTELREMFCYLYRCGGDAASACTKLYRASLIKELRFCEGIAHEDEELVTRMLPQCRRVIYTDLDIYGYIMRSGSIIHGSFNPHKLDVLGIMDERLAMLQKLGYYDLAAETQSRQFKTTANLYCCARRSGDLISEKRLKSKLKSLSKEGNLLLTGQYRLLYYLTRITGFAPDIYYFVRRICGKS